MLRYQYALHAIGSAIALASVLSVAHDVRVTVVIPHRLSTCLAGRCTGRRARAPGTRGRGMFCPCTRHTAGTAAGSGASPLPGCHSRLVTLASAHGCAGRYVPDAPIRTVPVFGPRVVDSPAVRAVDHVP